MLGEKHIQPQETVALEALEQHTDRLMRFPNVVGLGVGTEEKEDAVGYVVNVYVNEKPSSRKGFAQQHIPRRLKLRMPNESSKVEWVPTRIEPIGEIELE